MHGACPYAGTPASPSWSRLTDTYYQRLGVTPSASTPEIRAAYRALAGRLHPDRLIDASPAERTLADRRMREVNEAWRVLGDADRRRAYDEDQRRASGRSASPSASGPVRSSVPAVADDDDDDLVEFAGHMGPVKAGLFRHGVWVALAVTFAVIFVATAYATSSKEVDEPTGSQVGSCVDVSVGPSTTVVPCDGPHDLRIVTRIPDGGRCPVGTEKRRLAVDGYLECVKAA